MVGHFDTVLISKNVRCQTVIVRSAVVGCRKFDQLTALMHEENNWNTYRQEVDSKLSSNTSFVPFLGVFLTTTAFQQTAATRGSRFESRHGSAPYSSEKKVAAEQGQIYETYHLLEPITVRERLDKLRGASFDHHNEGML